MCVGGDVIPTLAPLFLSGTPPPPSPSRAAPSPSPPHQVREVGPCVELPGQLVGGDVDNLLQAEELRNVNDVLLRQAQLSLQDGPVQVDAPLRGRKGRALTVPAGSMGAGLSKGRDPSAPGSSWS